MAVWSKVKFSDMPPDLRLDAEHYQPEYLSQVGRITSGPFKTVADLADVSDGNHMSICEQFAESGIRYLRGQDLKDFFISDMNPIHIPEDNYRKLKRSHMVPDDILIGIVGTIGSVGFITDRHGALTGNCKLAIVRSREIEPEYLAAFFLSRLGQNEIHRRTRGTVQMGLILPDLRQIPVPLLNKTLRRKIAENVDASYKARQESLTLYALAERQLLSELGLHNLDLSPTLFYECSYSEAQQVARLDAEFFQPKYYVMRSNLERAAKRLTGTFVRAISKPLKYGTSDKLSYVSAGTPFLRIADIENLRFDPDAILRIPEEEVGLVKNARVATGDVVVSRSGTLGLAVAIPKELNGAVYGSYFIRVRPNPEIIHPEYLALYVNSLCGALQVTRLNSGGIQTNLTIPAIESIYLVYGDRNWQKRFTDLVEKSVAAHAESRRLLDEAKRMVEEAILGGEKS